MDVEERAEDRLWLGGSRSPGLVSGAGPVPVGHPLTAAGPRRRKSRATCGVHSGTALDACTGVRHVRQERWPLTGPAAEAVNN